MCFLLVLWFDITHPHTHTFTKTHSTHSGTSRLIHPYKYIFTTPVMSSQQLFLLHWMNNSLISRIYFPQCTFFSKIISVVKVIYLLIGCYKTMFFLWNTNNPDRNCVNNYKHLPFCGKNLKPPFFWKISKTQIPLYKGRGSNYVLDSIHDFYNSKKEQSQYCL